MTKTYEQLAAEDEAEERQDRVRVLHVLGLLRPDMTGLEVLMLHGKVCDDAEVKKKTPPYVVGEWPSPSTLEIVQALKPTERAALRTRILR